MISYVISKYAPYDWLKWRLKLYKLLEGLCRRVLYYDTDSVIYVSRDGDWEPEIGDFLGELTNEIDSNNHIVAFGSGGPKTMLTSWPNLIGMDTWHIVKLEAMGRMNKN